jgi:subtilisin-like proprotein convertase family protein
MTRADRRARRIWMLLGWLCVSSLCPAAAARVPHALMAAMGAAAMPDRRIEASDVPHALPSADSDAVMAQSQLEVADLVGALEAITVDLWLPHTYTADLTATLIGPDGTPVVLVQACGGDGDDFGQGRAPDQRTTFDDAAPAAIWEAAPPFVGRFRPQEPLASFLGKGGAAVNGTWTLHLVDVYGWEDGGSLQAWSLTLRVIAPGETANQPPTITHPDTACTGEDTPLRFSPTLGGGITLADPDAGDAPVKLTVSATHGLLTLATSENLLLWDGGGVEGATLTALGTLTALNAALDGLRFTPEADYNGPALLTLVCDDLGHQGVGGALCVSSAVAITIEAHNDAPVAEADGELLAAGILRNSRVTVDAPGVLTNDRDVEGHPLLAHLEQGPAHGAFTLASDGAFSYIPDPEWIGDDHFTYRASDGELTSDAMTVWLRVRAPNCPPVNVTPPAQTIAEDLPLVLSTGAGTALQITDPDAGDGEMAVTLTATNGLLSLARSDGVFLSLGDGVDDVRLMCRGTLTALNAVLDGVIFTPTPNFAGPATLEMVTDDRGNTGLGGAQRDTDVLAIAVLPVNDPPCAQDDAWGGEAGVPLTIAAPGVLANDADADGDPLLALLARAPLHGNLLLLPDGAFSYTPHPGWSGTDSFTYRVSDGIVESDPVTVGLTIRSGLGAEVIIDNADRTGITLVGRWFPSTSAPGYWGTNYLYDDPAQKGGTRAHFAPTLPGGGWYTVALRWRASAVSLAAAVPLEITHAGGVESHSINQQLGGGAWVEVGDFAFPAGTGARVTLNTEGTTGYVIADAVRFTPVRRLRVVVPNGGERWAAGSAHLLRWTAAGLPGVARVDLLDGQGSVYRITDEVVLAAGSISWTVPAELAPGTTYRVRITSAVDAVLSDQSDVAFTVLPPPQPAEVILDNAAASGVTRAGAWYPSTTAPGFWGADYLYDNPAQKGMTSVRFTPTLPAAGTYAVFLRWRNSATNLAREVPVDLVSLDGQTTVRVNQQVGGGSWVLLGVYRFAAGAAGSVTLRTTGTSGYVIADAVRFTPAPLEVIVDNADATGVTRVGTWFASKTFPGYWGTDYLYDDLRQKGMTSIGFSPVLTVPGTYAVYLRWRDSASTLAASVPVDIDHQGGTETVRVNQQIGGGGWVWLGRFPFTAAGAPRVTLRTTGTSGYVIADAVRFVRE